MRSYEGPGTIVQSGLKHAVWLTVEAEADGRTDGSTWWGVFRTTGAARSLRSGQAELRVRGRRRTSVYLDELNLVDRDREGTNLGSFVGDGPSP